MQINEKTHTCKPVRKHRPIDKQKHRLTQRFYETIRKHKLAKQYENTDPENIYKCTKLPIYKTIYENTDLHNNTKIQTNKATRKKKLKFSLRYFQE